MIKFTMDTLELLRDMNAFAFASDTNELLRERLTSIPGVDADKITAGIDILWANYALLSDHGKEVLAQLCLYVSAQGWTMVNADGRCDRIVEAVRRDLGEPGDWPDAETDPERRTALSVVPVEEEQPINPAPTGVGG